ncbi:MAG: S8 family serine peptidase [Syntrophorhabdaceae bacterium]|nr:S8 family serine peptidase [Syntrophorhabdaceae bacterium]
MHIIYCMILYLYLLIFLSFFVFYPFDISAQSVKDGEQNGYVEGELLIKFKEGVSHKEKASFLKKHNLDRLREFKRARIHHIKLPKGVDLKEYLEKLKKDKDVEYVEPNYKRRPMGIIPDDPALSEQWGLTKIGMPSVWNSARGSKDIIVAVIDTGVDYNHPDLAPNMWKNNKDTEGNKVDDDGNGFIDDVYGWNFYSKNNNPMDYKGHGTHVAGIIGAVTNNGLGVAGVNWQVSIMPLKFMEAEGDVASEIDAIEYALDMGAKIINASFGDSTFTRAEYDAIKAAGERGALFIAAAGNSRNDNDGVAKNYPASYTVENKINGVTYPPLTNIISVAATDGNDNIATFSNYGAISVHLGAPGVNILSTIPQGRSDMPGASLTVNGVKYKAYGMEYSGQVPKEGITRQIFYSGYGARMDEFPPEVRGNIALIKRGSEDGSAVTFKDKTINAQNAGAVAAIIYNNQSGYQIVNGTLSEPGEWIPVISISMEDGEKLKSMGNPTATLINYPYNTNSGTSMATPFVSGVAALLWSLKPDAKASEIKEIIMESVDPVDSLTGKTITGGRLNALKAIQKMATQIPVKFVLNRGWNFVSFPGVPEGGIAIEQLFKDISDNVKVVWGFDNRTKEWELFRFNAQNSRFKPLQTIEPEKGYWVYMADSRTLNLNGTSLPYLNLTLYDGWNLVGYGGYNGSDVRTSLSSLSGNWVIVWGWEDGQWYARHSLSDELPINILPLETLKVNKAYWLKMNSPGKSINWVQ